MDCIFFNNDFLVLSFKYMKLYKLMDMMMDLNLTDHFKIYFELCKRLEEFFYFPIFY